MSHFTLREFTPADGPAIAALGDQSPETGAIAFHSHYHHDPYAALLALRPATVGVVAEAPDQDGIVGMGLMDFGECWYEGAVRPFAYLYSLSVHPAFRQRGLGSQIAAWRIENARARFGEEGVIYAGIQSGNVGSLRTARKWSTQRLDGRTAGAIVTMRSRPPQPAQGLEVRPAELGDFEEIVQQQNSFYREHNLYTPRSVDSLHAWVRRTAFGLPLSECFVAVERGGSIVAGLCLTDEGRVISMQIVRMIWPLRLAARLYGMVPSDGAIRRIQASDFWHAPGRAAAGSYLWESLRWLWRDRANMMMLFYDARSDLASVVRPPWLVPSGGGSLVLRAPVPLHEDRLLYLQHM